MLTIRAEIKKGEQKSDGTYNVKLRFTHQRKVKRLSTSLFVRPEDLTKSLSFKNGTPIKNDIDNLVNEYRMRCNKLPIDIEGYTLDEIMGELEAEEKRNQTIDFIQFCTQWIKDTTIKGKGNYQTALSAFKSYINADHLPTSRITSSLLKGFIEFLQERADEREKSLVKAGKRVPPDRTVSQYLGSIRHLFNEAKRTYNDYDRNIIVISNSPFESMKVPKQRATRKRAVPPELLKAMWKIPYKNTIRGRSKTCPIDFAKDTFNVVVVHEYVPAQVGEDGELFADWDDTDLIIDNEGESSDPAEGADGGGSEGDSTTGGDTPAEGGDGQ